MVAVLCYKAKNFHHDIRDDEEENWKKKEFLTIEMKFSGRRQNLTTFPFVQPFKMSENEREREREYRWENRILWCILFYFVYLWHRLICRLQDKVAVIFCFSICLFMTGITKVPTFTAITKPTIHNILNSIRKGWWWYEDFWCRHNMIGRLKEKPSL